MADASPGGARCDHCGLSVRLKPGRERPAGASLFCCVGCRLAAAAAGGAGEGRAGLEARLLLSAFLAMGIMTFSLVLYGESVFGAEDARGMGPIRQLLQAGLAVLSLPVMLLLGVPLFRGAWADLRLRQLRMDGLIVLATVAAFALSLAHTIQGEGPVYYETATMVLVLVTFGRRLEAHARTRGLEAAEELLALLPETTLRRDAGGAFVTVPVRELTPGDVVRVRPGEAVPADGRVLSGRSELAAAHVTGEEAPRPAGPGDAVRAGAVNGSGLLEVSVGSRPLEGSLGRILALLDEPLAATGAMRLGDRIAGWLALAAVTAAAIGGVRSGLDGGAGAGLRTALSCLLVACPCALGLAMPLAYRAMRASLARAGVLVHEVAALERGAGIDRVRLDKTGTLTTARDARLELRSGAAESLDRLAGLVVHSGHALAGAMGAIAAPPAPGELRVHPGDGVEGSFDGALCRAGRPEWLDGLGLTWNDELVRAREEAARSGATVVAYSEGAAVRGVATVRHAVSAETGDAVRWLRHCGLDPRVLSGDRAEAAAALADELGIPAEGGLLPADKVARIAALQRAGHRVLFAGDGINDAPALRAADVGLAVGGGTAAARSQAGVEILGEDLGGIRRFLEGARELRRVVRGNFFWTLAYNGVALGFAAMGRLHPLVAVGAMIASSLAVSARSYRLMGREGAA